MFNINYKTILYFSIIVIISMIILTAIGNHKHPQQRINNNIETYTNHVEAETKHMDKNYTIKDVIPVINFATRDEIFNTMITHPYFDRMTSLDIVARKMQNATHLKKQYMNDMKELTDADKETIKSIIRQLMEERPNMLLFLTKSLQLAKFAKTSPQVEYGLPHTHGNIIFMPFIVDNELTADIIIHELTHVFQRNYGAEFDKLYARWGFEKAKYIDNFKTIKNAERNNPDANGDIYIWRDDSTQKYYWIGALYISPEPANIKDIGYYAVEVYRIGDGIFKSAEGATKHQKHPLETFEPYINFFNLYNNHYHPNEISAEYMTISNNGKKIQGSPAYKIYKNFFEALMHSIFPSQSENLKESNYL